MACVSDTCREREREYNRERRWLLKAEGIAKYGGCCRSCGEKDIELLEFHHIDGGGDIHRRAQRTTDSVAILYREGWPAGIEVLCKPCHIETDRERLREAAKKGGVAATAKLTFDERSRRAKKAATKMWARKNGFA